MNGGVSTGKMLLFIFGVVVVWKVLSSPAGAAAEISSGFDSVVSTISTIGAAGTTSAAGPVSTPAIAAHIRRCESSNNYRAQNSHSTASGAYQFIDATWRGTTGLPGHAKNYPPATQDRAFVKLWAGGKGAHNWNASRSCWGRYWRG